MDDIKSIPISSYSTGKIINIGSGKQRVNPCPKCGHNDCCTVYTDNNSFHCFSCNTGGSVIDYVMAITGWDFTASARKIAEDHNIPFGEKNVEKAEKNKLNEKIFDEAAEYYHKVLLKNKKRMEYLTIERQRSLEMIDRYNYGLADGKLHAYLLKKGYTLDQLVDSGLVRRNETRTYDLFSLDFIVYPVYLHGRICNFYVKKGKDSYNVPKTFRHRDAAFYGEEDIHHDTVIIVEGQEDRNTIKQLSDDYHVIATLGNFKPDQKDMLFGKLPGKNVYACFDNDPQGREYLNKFAVAYAHLCNIYVIDYPSEFKDIDEYVRSLSADERYSKFSVLIDKAKDVITHKIESLEIPEEMNMKTAEGMYMPIIELIARENNDIAAASYIEALGNKFGNKSRFENALRTMIRKMRKKNDGGEEFTENYSNSIIGKRGCRYYHRMENGDKQISNFIIKIKRYVEINGDLYYECVFKNINGEESRLSLLSKADRITKNRFREFCAGVGSYYYSGSENDLSEIWQIEESEANIEFRTCYFQRYGFIKEHNLWLFKNCAYRGSKMHIPSAEDEDIITIDGIGYKSQDVFVCGGDQPILNIKDRPSKEYNEKIIRLMWRMMDARNDGDPKDFKGFLLMGFLAAVAYLPEIAKKERRFPYLLVFGEPQTGKSECVQKLMNMMGFQNGGENWRDATVAGITMAMEQLSGISYWVEEFSNPAGASTKDQNKIEMLKNIYNRTGSGKGGIGARQIREVNASMVMTGQDRPENHALLSRCVVLRKEMPTPANSEAFYILKSENEARRLSLVFRWLLENKTKERINEYFENYKIWQNEIQKRASAKGYNLKPRLTENISIFAAAFSLYDFHQYDDAFLNWIVDMAIEDMVREQSENIITRFFSDIDTLYTHQEMVELIKKEDGILYMKFHTIYKDWIVMQRKTGMSEYISQGGLQDYFVKSPDGYWVDFNLKNKIGRKKIYINGREARVIGFYIDRLPKGIRDVVDTWLEREAHEVRDDSTV